MGVLSVCWAFFPKPTLISGGVSALVGSELAKGRAEYGNSLFAPSA